MLKVIRYSLIGMFLLSALVFHGCEKESKLPVDGDGNVYDTVRIGTQTWLAEDLKTTKYNNGVSIPLVTDNTQWASMSSAAFCWYENNPAYKEDYGALYNWYAAKVYHLCPIGYHVPTIEEWSALINYLGGEYIAGAKLKDRERRFWLDYDDCEANEYGFKARPGGGRSPVDGHFGGIREEGTWLSTTKSVYEDWIKGISIEDDFCEIKHEILIKLNAGSSIRCIKNN